jgi:hypothetical protein
MIKDPKPGSKEAIEAGCNCPVMDNHHGEGIPFNKPGTSDIMIGYWMTADCVIHGVKDAAKED